jgi:competence protein ComEA
MLKRILAIVAMLYAFAAFAAVDVNKASAADLDGIKGIGPAISGKIVDERKKGAFKDWQDFIDRVKGVGEVNAAKFSADGLTVNGSGFKGAVAAPAAAKKDEKKAEAKPAAPAAAAAPAAKEEKKDAKADAKAEAKAKKEAEKQAKADAKAKKAEEAKAKKEAKAAAKADKKEAKAEAAKPAASAASAAKK